VRWSARLVGISLLSALLLGCGVPARADHAPLGGSQGHSAWTHPKAHAVTVRARASTRANSGRSPFGPAVRTYLGSRVDLVSAALLDLRTRELWRLNPNTAAQPTASIIKVDILEALLYQAATNDEWLPPIEAQLAPSMIEISSNSAATTLWHMAGGARGISAFNSLAGLVSTRLSTCVACAGFAWPGWGLTTTTPTDQIQLLKQLALPSGLLDAAARHYALRLMMRIIAPLRFGVTGGVPSGVKIAMKSGDVPLNGDDSDWQVNSIGWIQGDGADYLFAMLSTRNPSLQYGIATLDEISSLVWSHWAR